MGKPLQARPLSAVKIKRIMANNPSNQKQVVQAVSAPAATQPVTLKRQLPFDSLSPEEKLREFLAFCRDVIARYEDNARRQTETERATQDLLHYVELSEDMNACRGYCMYSKIAETRRERRACKSENELLQPLYDFLKDKSLINQLAQIQGQCRTAKESINLRTYTLRTDVIQ